MDAFTFRPLREHPIYRRRACYEELEKDWPPDEVRLLCPLVEFIGATVNKLARSKSPAILLIPEWPRQPWYQAARHLVKYNDRRVRGGYYPDGRMRCPRGWVCPRVGSARVYCSITTDARVSW